MDAIVERYTLSRDSMEFLLPFKLTEVYFGMKTNELKKGMRIRLRNGWEADLADNMNGQTRMAKVYGFETEIGSVYSHDIVAVRFPAIADSEGERWIPIEHTPAQLKLQKFAF